MPLSKPQRPANDGFSEDQPNSRSEISMSFEERKAIHEREESSTASSSGQAPVTSSARPDRSHKKGEMKNEDRPSDAIWKLVPKLGLFSGPTTQGNSQSHVPIQHQKVLKSPNTLKPQARREAKGLLWTCCLCTEKNAIVLIECSACRHLRDSSCIINQKSKAPVVSRTSQVNHTRTRQEPPQPHGNPELINNTITPRKSASRPYWTPAPVYDTTASQASATTVDDLYRNATQGYALLEQQTIASGLTPTYGNVYTNHNALQTHVPDVPTSVSAVRTCVPPKKQTAKTSKELEWFCCHCKSTNNFLFVFCLSCHHTRDADCRIY